MTFRIWGTENLAQLGQAGYDNVVAALPNGGYVVGFYANSSIYFQRYDGAGAKLGGPTLVVATGTGVTLDDVDIHSVGPNGNFVVAWTEAAGMNSVKTRVFSAEGLPVTEAINIGSFGGVGSALDAPSVVGGSNGNFVTVYNDPTNAAGIKLSVYDAATGTVVRTLNIGPADGRFGDITMLGPNKYVVSYQINDGDIVQKVVDLDAADPLAGAQTAVGTGKFSDVVKWGNDGGYAVIYSEAVSTGDLEVKAKFFDSNGADTGLSATITNNGQRTQDLFGATALSDGRVAVIYSERVGTGNSLSDHGDIFLRIINADGSVGAIALPLNSDATTDTNDAQVVPSVTEMADGRLAVSWHDRYGQARVLTNIVDVREAAVTVNGTASNDVYAGSAHDGNELNGLGGNDKLIGGSGRDDMDGDDGIDTASYERSAERVIVSLAGGPGAGGDAAGDTYEEIENLIGSQHDNTITGNDVANYLWGLGGNDALIGGGGEDALEGGAGDDSYYVDASDIIIEAAGGGIDTVYTKLFGSGTLLGSGALRD